MAKQDSAATRKKIFEAVVALSREIGIENITFQKVAKKSGVSYYGVHYHFGQKEKGLTLATVEYVGTVAEQYISRKIETCVQDPTINLIEAYVEGTFEWARELHDQAVFWVHYYYLCSAEGTLRDMNGAAVGKARQRIASLILETVGRGQIPRVRDVDLLAIKIHQQIVGGVIGYLTERPAASFKIHRDAASSAVRDLVQGHSAGQA